MNAVTEFDIGPLTWVKSEIDLALERSDQALQQYKESVAADAGDLTQIKFCRTHLHQVQGALTIVGLDGVTQFAEAVEAMLEAIEQQTRPPKESSIALAQLALATIGHYLDDLINGQPNQPLRLLSLYREVQGARGLQNVSATDLFFPDLTARPPRRETPTRKISRTQFQSILRQERGRFQRGLLSWLRNPQDRKGISEMLGAVQRIEDTQDAASARAFWWITAGFLSALAEGALAQETDAKQMCARIDMQIRRLLEGSKNVAERLMRDALYLVASAHSNNSLVRLVKKTYQLQAVIPTTETAAPAPEETVRRKLRDVITATEEAWNKYCTGSMQSLPLFKDHANALTAVVEQLGHTDYRRLVQAIAAAANWLSDDSTRHSEALAMEIATAILLTQNAQENFQRLGSDFAHQVDVTVARIHGCLAGAPPQPGSEIPLLDEMSRQAQEKLLVGQVAKEIQSNFAQIEQVLDGFFRDVARRADLVSLEVPFRQVAGALTMMRHDSAVEAVRECSAEIKRFTDPEYEPQETDFERVANQLSLIGFFIDSLQHGATDFESFVRQMQSGLAQEVKGSEEAEEDEGEEPGITLEQEVDRQKLETHALLGALKEQQGDTGLREEIKLNLVALKNDAELVADTALGEQTKAMLSALATGEDASSQIDQVMATLKPQLPELIQPSAETIQLAQASTEEVDAELLGIFLEEANEVLGTIDENLKILKNQPHDFAVLTTIRRSFHTLKGSGRMVGLKDVGEVAWSIEQTLNQWLQQELQVGPSLVQLLEQAHSIFSTWVKYLETHSGSAPDAGDLIAFAEYLRHGKEEDSEETAIIIAEPASPDVVAEPETSIANDVTLEAPQELLEPVPSAEIITLSISSAQAEREDGDLVIDLEAVKSAEITNVDFAAPLAEMPVLVADQAPLSADEHTDESVPDEPGTHQRITISPALFAIFSEEASTHLATLQQELPVLESDEISPTPHDMYRAAHTLAGISATVGITPINRLGLALEHALLRRDNSAQPGSLEALGTIRLAIGELELMLSALAGQQAPDVPLGLIEALDALYPANVIAPHEQSVAAEQPAIAEASPTPEEARPEFAPRAAFVPEPQKLQDEIDQQLLPIFLEEALDLNQGIATQLRAWRSEPGNAEAVRMLTRLLHTLKGSAR
ncbi:MAG: Hpt domain-containing protein, partial [Propionivibrio sp.]|uniref:Hpt domain-containing protein n=1 Tax=Propionivibrio sp. TaxID=2212460 RepID=UPI001A50ADA6